MYWEIPLADLDLGPEEESAVLAVLRRGWLTMGGETKDFEEEFAAFTGAKHAIAVANCTAALHLACLALGLGAGGMAILSVLNDEKVDNYLKNNTEWRMDLWISPK